MFLLHVIGVAPRDPPPPPPPPRAVVPISPEDSSTASLSRTEGKGAKQRAEVVMGTDVDSNCVSGGGMHMEWIHRHTYKHASTHTHTNTLVLWKCCKF